MVELYEPTSADQQQCLDYLQAIEAEGIEVKNTITAILDKITKGLLKFQDGHTLVGLKNHMLLNYIINLTNLMMKKINGESISNSGDIWRMIETRTVMEKMRGLEQKLKYEIEKKLNEAVNGHAKSDVPKFKPCANLLSQTSNDEDDNEEDRDDNDNDNEKRRNRNDIYVPPKMVPKFYVEDEPLKVKREKILEKARKKAVRSSIMNDLRTEFTDQPEEIYNGVGFNKANDKEKVKEKTEYEEKYFTRMQMSKKDKAASKKMRSLTSNLLDFGRFSDVAVLTGHDENLFKSDCGKKRKARNTGKGSKKKRVKFH